jgi:hypothetical protein
MHHKFDRRSRAVRNCVSLASAISICLVFGCMSPNPAPEVQKFAKAVAITATNAAGAFDVVQTGYVEEQISEIALKPNAEEFNPANIEPFLSSQAIEARIEVLDVLELYAAKLSMLTGNSSDTNLEQQTSKFATALKKLDTNLVSSSLMTTEKVTPQEINIFMTALNTVAEWIIQRKENQEAKSAIGEMKGPVNAICGLLSADLARLHGELRAEYQQTLMNDDKGMIDNWPRLTPMERRGELRNLEHLTASLNKADSTLLDLQGAVTNLAAAHEALDQVFTKDNTTAASLIEEFSAEAQGIGKYYNSLGTNK